ncbi:MAG: 7TM-DISM domain-containing protein [Betaproteobacteria bacterium]
MSIDPIRSLLLHALRFARVLLLSLGLLSQAWAEPLSMAIGPDSRIDLTPVIQLLRDATHSLSVDDVATKGSEFRAVSREELRVGFDTSSFWLRVSLINLSNDHIERWLTIGHPRIQSVTLFQRTGSGWQGLKSGSQVPRDLKPIPTTVPAFPLHIDAGETRELLIRVQSETALDLDATLWSSMAFQLEQENRHLLVILAVGFSLLTALTSLIAYYFIRETQYLYFALLHFSASIVDLSREGLFQQTLWPSDLPFSPQLITVSSACALISLVFLQRNVLLLRQQLPRWDKIFLVIATVSVVAIPISFVNYSLAARSISIIVSSFFVLTIITLFQAGWKGQSARFLALAYGVLWVNETARQLTNLKLLSISISFQLSISWALILASPLMVMALAARTRQLSSQLMLTQQTNQAKTEFIARISHELRTPLNTIIGYARMLGRNSPRLSLKDGINDIEQNAQRLLGMIDELLDQSRIETGRLRLTPHPLVFGAWLHELERAAIQQSEAAGNVFRMIGPDPCPPQILIDHQRLRQIIDNLIANANQHTHGGSIELKVEALAAGTENQLRITFRVKDDGSGIAVEDQVHVFEPFFQGKPAQEHKSHLFGMGLGLSIANDLVRLMGGELSVRSKPGAGSSFEFWIECPCVEPLPAELENENANGFSSEGFLNPEVLEAEKFPLSADPVRKPDASLIKGLKALIDAGEITEIEKWCDTLSKAEPDCIAYACEVRKAAQAIDFLKLSQLASISLDRKS